MAHESLHTPVCDTLGIDLPIFAFSHCKDVVVEVCNAGGLGVLGVGRRLPDEIAADIRWVRERLGDRPFGVDVLIPASVPAGGSRAELVAQIPEEHRRFVQQLKAKYGIPDPDPSFGRESFLRTQEGYRGQLDVILEERVPVFASGVGNPAFLLDTAHERGIKVVGLVGNVRQARREAEAGVDIIVAQGYDAGGHTGRIGTFSLVPQVVASVGPVPVLAAGGVGSGRHLAAALCLGAQGVWTGTIWLTSRESDTDMLVKEKILRATEEDTTISRAVTGKTARMLKTAWTEEWEQPDAPPPLPMPLQSLLVDPVLHSAMRARIEPLMWSPAGQVVGMIDELKPARQIVFDLASEALDVLSSLHGQTV